jgi:nucleoside-diphosphate-sugar epimerase
MEGFERVHVAGVRHLVDLALASPRTKAPRFLFCSSISSIAYCQRSSVPEASIEDESWATLGYGLSKLVGERISEAASKKAGLNAAIVRIGQIS